MYYAQKEPTCALATIPAKKKKKKRKECLPDEGWIEWLQDDELVVLYLFSLSLFLSSAIYLLDGSRSHQKALLSSLITQNRLLCLDDVVHSTLNAYCLSRPFLSLLGHDTIMQPTSIPLDSFV